MRTRSIAACLAGDRASRCAGAARRVRPRRASPTNGAPIRARSPCSAASARVASSSAHGVGVVGFGFGEPLAQLGDALLLALDRPLRLRTPPVRLFGLLARPGAAPVRCARPGRPGAPAPAPAGGRARRGAPRASGARPPGRPARGRAARRPRRDPGSRGRTPSAPAAPGPPGGGSPSARMRGTWSGTARRRRAPRPSQRVAAASSSSARNASATSAISAWSSGGSAPVRATERPRSSGRLDSCGARILISRSISAP